MDPPAPSTRSARVDRTDAVRPSGRVDETAGARYGPSPHSAVLPMSVSRVPAVGRLLLLLAHPGAAARGRASAAVAAALLALAALVALPIVDPAPATAAAAGRPRAVIVVGPVEGATASYKRDANRIADQLRAHGARVRKVYSPWATWSRVREAARGANIFVYLGHGNGYPSPYGRFDPRKMNGLGLNARGGRGNANGTYVGEYYVRRGLHLAPGAVVILNHVCYAAGSSEPGRAYPSRTTARKRADNFAAGFLRAGAAAVFASDRSVVDIIRGLFGGTRTMSGVFWGSPWTTLRYDSGFRSRRTPGATGILAPYRPGAYFQSVVGELGWTTAAWRATWSAPTVVPAPDPTPEPTPGPTPEPEPTPTPVDAAEPAPEPTPSAEPSPDPEPTPVPTPAPQPTPVPEPFPSP